MENKKGNEKLDIFISNMKQMFDKVKKFITKKHQNKKKQRKRGRLKYNKIKIPKNEKAPAAMRQTEVNKINGNTERNKKRLRQWGRLK